jgi:hypothetical protein
MAEFLGDGVSRTLSAKARQFVNVVWQKGAPPLDSELNLTNQMLAEAQQALVSANVSSGWIGNPYDAMADYEFDRQASNMFWLGKAEADSEGDILWANVNGWMVPVMGTQSPDSRNAIMLPPPQGTVSDSDVNFVFLEVWKAQVSPDGDKNKPGSSLLYKYGNVEYGGANLGNDLVDPAMKKETTERVQLQYRLRVANANPALNPNGFGAGIRAQGTLDNPTANANPMYRFTNMRDEMGDPGLWRAGDGDGESGLLGTVDGYVYAIPLCFVFRRSTLSWTKVAQHGAYNRNPGMSDRTEAEVLPTIKLTADLEMGDTEISVDTTQSATTLSASGGLIQVDSEIIEYSGYTGTTITIATRGAKGTYATKHTVDDTVDFVTGHPQGLFSDQIVPADVLDLRHIISTDGVDYDGLLLHNFNRLAKGELTTTWKKSSGNLKGRRHFQVDFFGASPMAPDYTEKADVPDGHRKVFSDACSLQPNNMLVLGSSPSSSDSSDYALNADASISRSNDTGWKGNDVVRVTLDQFRNTFPFADAEERKKVRFVHPYEYEGSEHEPVRMWFGDTDPASGDPRKEGALGLSSSDTDPWFMVLGTMVEDLPFSSSGQADLVFDSSGTITITGRDFSTGTTSIGDQLASMGAWIVITEGDDAADTQPENHGAYRITGNSGLALSVETAAGTTPSFSSDTANRTWELRLPECSENDDDMVVALVRSGLEAAGTSLSLSYDLLYHPARGLSRVPEKSSHVELDPGNATNYLREDDYLNVSDSANPTVKKSTIVPLASYPHHHHTKMEVRDPQDLRGRETVWSEAYVDRGSKTLLYQPVRNVNAQLSLISNQASAVSYTDPTGTFELGTGQSDASVLVPKELRPSLGRIDLPFVRSKANVSNTSTEPAYGLNCMLLSGSTGLSDNNSFIEQRTVAVFDPVNMTESDYGDYKDLSTVGGGPGGVEALVCRYYNKGGVRGIEIPAHYGVARLFAIYKQSDFYTVSAGDSNFSAPEYRVDSGVGRLNLLRESGERRSLIITDDNTFVIPEDVIDQNYFTDELADEPLVFEFASFFFDDWTSDFMRLHRRQNTSPTSGSFQMFVNGPAESGDEFYLVSTRTPYQGSIYGTMPSSTSDTSTVDYTDYRPKRNTESQLDVLDLFTAFDAEEDVRVENASPLEILAALPFATTIGTGAVSGPVVPGSYTDVGYLSLENYPFESLTDSERQSKVRAHPYTASGASVAKELSETLCGLSERLPLGLVVGDYQMLSEGVTGEYKRFWTPNVSLEGPVDMRGDCALSKSLMEGTLIFSDGTSGLEYEHDHELYRTHRGGTVMVGSGTQPGGAVTLSGDRVYKDFPYLNSPDDQNLQMHGAVLFGVAFLVRNKKELVTDDQIEASNGDELQMLVLTGLTLGKELDLTGDFVKEFVDLFLQMHPLGIGEGYCAADRFRVEGRPLQKRTRNKADAADVDVFRGRDPSGEIADPFDDGNC